MRKKKTKKIIIILNNRPTEEMKKKSTWSIILNILCFSVMEQLFQLSCKFSHSTCLAVRTIQ
jgi:hypothetical protein